MKRYYYELYMQNDTYTIFDRLTPNDGTQRTALATCSDVLKAQLIVDALNMVAPESFKDRKN